MTDMEIKNVIVNLTDDQEYIHEVAETKRALELWTMEPGFREEFLVAPEKTLAKHGLVVDALAITIFPAPNGSV